MIDDAMPRSVVRPLHLAAIALICIIVLIGIWAKTAPLATTIRAQGILISTHPPHALQHQYGGPIAEVHTRLHASVRKGQKLFTLDSSTQEKTLDTLTSQREISLAENTAIRQILARDDVKTSHHDITDLYLRLTAENELSIETMIHSASSAKDRIIATQVGLQLLRAREEAVLKNLNDQNGLLGKGLTTQRVVQSAEDQLLQIRVDINAAEVNILTLADQQMQSSLQAERLDLEYRSRLQNTLTQNLKQLTNINRQIFHLEDEISHSEVRAPISGTIAAINFDTNQMYAPRGQTIATISQRLSHPTVQLTIPTNAVDQVYEGMTGQLTIPALPQRGLPIIQITLDAVSPDAIKDDNGIPTGYLAKATIASADMQAVHESFDGELRLSADMPVNVSLTGRKITFFDFLISPFFNTFSQSLQD